MTRVKIVYGFAEGQWQSTKLDKELGLAGYKVVTEGPAEIIIAHSGGCYLLDTQDQTHTKLILLVGFPHWPDRHIGHSFVNKLRTEPHTWWFVKNLFFNTLYLFRYPLRWRRMHRAWKDFLLPASQIEATVVAVHNKNDHFMHPLHAESVAKNRGWHFVKFANHHDDIWTNPKNYVALINKYMAS